MEDTQQYQQQQPISYEEITPYNAKEVDIDMDTEDDIFTD